MAMAATEFSRSPAANNGINQLSRTQGILIETMQLVEPTKSLPVPNHILESSKWSNMSRKSGTFSFTITVNTFKDTYVDGTQDYPWGVGGEGVGEKKLICNQSSAKQEEILTCSLVSHCFNVLAVAYRGSTKVYEYKIGSTTANI